MNVPQTELDGWADACARINGLLLQAEAALRREQTETAGNLVESARRVNVTTKHALERAGAADPRPEHVPMPEETPIQLLDTPANRRYAAALRAAYEALQEVERERGIEDGASEVLEDWLVEVELEIYGPTGHGEGIGR